ncbi:hypothetical protein GCE9029_03714 [Grimontia celer]|uniref:Uncharacterized protein n=1 Tax=Grimontia celer TaxID=1796497 RepID=A0A128F916_9GAMM|nr:hypothetical protein [Grimontia celer]CZF83238.1 hypothetical protein GCE9029_03714 [Grimontia celer]
MADIQPIGNQLAERVYDLVIEGHTLGFCHYGYCGVGFVSEEGIVQYTHFDEWLSTQTDHSLSGSEAEDKWYSYNQRVTKDRLEDFATKLTV